MRIDRIWCMPNHLTFQIAPIAQLFNEEVHDGLWIDPFARDSKVASITNDINPETTADHHMDALEFLRTFDDKSVDGVLFDPPYSLRQVKECYDEIGRSLTDHESKHFFEDLKDEISRITKSKGRVISFGWNSGGVGKTRGFTLERVLLVPHGGIHNDTIVTVEVKSLTIKPKPKPAKQHNMGDYFE